MTKYQKYSAASAVAVHQHPDHEGRLEGRQDGVKLEDFEEIIHARRTRPRKRRVDPGRVSVSDQGRIAQGK